MITAKKQTGFTLIELMIVVAIIGALAGIAVPAYNEYIIRSRITHATSGLSAKRVQLEQFFQDNHTYFQAEGADPVTDPEISSPACNTDDATSTYFTFVCDPAATATTYTLKATGKGPMTGFIFTVNHANGKASPFSGAPAGWSAHSPDNCWVTGKAGAC